MAVSQIIGASIADGTIAAIDITDGTITSAKLATTTGSGSVVLSASPTITGNLTVSGTQTNSALTSGRITYASTGGLLTDSSALTYDGTTVTATKFAGALNGSLGATTPSTVVATSVTNSGLTSGRVMYASTGGLVTDSSNLQFNGTNLGLGVAPSAWGSIFKVTQIGSAYPAFVAGRTDSQSQIHIGANAYYDGTNWTYVNTGYASRYFQSDSSHVWQTAPSSSGTITFTSAMTLDASGYLGIGTTTPSSYGGLAVRKAVTVSSVPVSASFSDSANSTFDIRHSPNIVNLNAQGSGITINTGNSTRMTITDAGLVGIGAASPNYPLDISASGTYTALAISNTYSNANSRNWAITTNGQQFGDINFWVSNAQGGNPISAGTTKMTILSNGNVGIGEATPTTTLDVNGAITALGGNTPSTGGFKMRNVAGTVTPRLTSDGADGTIIRPGASGAYVAVNNYANSLNLFYITDAGNVGIGVSNPLSLLHVNASDGVTGVTIIGGGNSNVAAVGEINAQLDFRSNDASVNNTNQIGGRIASVTEASNGAEVGLSFYTFQQGAATPLSEKLRITYNGNVGIGVTSPTAKLQINAATDTIKTYGSSYNQQIYDSVTGAFSQGVWQVNAVSYALVGAGGGGNMVINTAGNSTANMIFSTGSGTTERMRIASNGDVTIGNAVAGTNVNLILNGVVSKAQRIYFSNSGVEKWLIGAGAASETSAFEIYNTNGTMALSIAKSDSISTFGAGVNVTGNLYASGNLGVGVSPLDKLHIENGTLRISGTTAQAIYLYGAATVKPYITLNEYGIVNFYIGAGSTTSGVLSLNGNSVGDSSGLHIKASNGYVGIGTSSPTSKLDVYADSGSQSIKMRVATTSQASVVATNSRDYIQIAVDASATYLDAGTVSPLLFFTGGSEKIRIDTSGNLGLGTTSPSTFGKVAIQVTGSTTPTTGANVGPASVNMYVGANGGTGSTTGFFGWFDGTPGLGAGMGITRESSGDWGTALRFFNHPSATSNIGDITERMRITSGGNVGIGTTDPDYGSYGATERILGITGVATNRGRLSLQNTSTGSSGVAGTIAFWNGSTVLASLDINADGATNKGLYAFNTNNGTSVSERMRIDSSGILLVGTTSATGQGTRLGVYNTADTSVIATFQNAHNVSGDQAGAFYLGSNCNDTSSVYINGSLSGLGVTFKIFGNGNMVNSNNSYGSLSDIKLKENIVDATSKLANLMQVKVRNYNLINSTIKQIGVIAQELETIFPSMIDESRDKDDEGNDLGTTTKSVKYSVFVPMLIKAIQEQQALIESLTSRLTALEGK